MIEEKLDGERINLHKRGDTFQYFSRKGKDYTYLYGKDASSGTLTPFIASCFRSDVVDCILDGEMLAFDPSENRCLPFGTLKSAALDQAAGPDDPRPCCSLSAHSLLASDSSQLIHMKRPNRSQGL